MNLLILIIVGWIIFRWGRSKSKDPPSKDYEEVLHSLPRSQRATYATYHENSILMIRKASEEMSKSNYIFAGIWMGLVLLGCTYLSIKSGEPLNIFMICILGWPPLLMVLTTYIQDRHIRVRKKLEKTMNETSVLAVKNFNEYQKAKSLKNINFN